MTIKREAGRTMVEMLGVLAIIVVLSGLGIWSVNLALNYYKAYRISSAAQERTILVKQNTRIRKNKDTGYSNLLNGDVMGIYPIEYVPAYSVAAYNVDGLKAFQVSAFNQSVCRHLKNIGTLKQIKDYTGLPVLINNTDIDDDPECIPGDETANKLIVLFDEGRGRSVNNPCAGVECACGSCVNGACSDTEKTITLCDGTTHVCCAGDPNCKDEEGCCPANRIYTDNGVTKCCDNVLSGGHCCATGESWASADNKCCITGNISNDHCCAGGQTYATTDNKCCANDKLYDNNTKCCAGTIRTLSNGTRVCQGPGQCWYNNQVYNNNAAVGTCGKCVNGTVSPDTSKVTDCHTCNTSNWTLSNTTSNTTDSSGKCCVNGVRTYDATRCPQGCTHNGTTYASGAAVGTCGKCVNGTISTDTSKVTDCHTCNTSNWTLSNTTSNTTDSSGKCCVNGVRTYDATRCPQGCTHNGTTYASGAAVGTCGKCVNGTISTDTSKVGTCKVCNTSTWALGNATNGSNKQGTQCCVNGAMAESAQYCPKGCTVGGKTYADGATIGTCKQCSNGSVVAKSGYTVPTCQICNADGSVTPAANTVSCGSDGCSRCDGAGKCVSKKVTASYKAYNGNCCETKSATYCSLTESAPADTCSANKTSSSTTNKTCSTETTITDLCTNAKTTSTTNKTNGTTVGQCGKCMNGTPVRGDQTAPTCQSCNVTTWNWQGHTGAVGACGKCNGQTYPNGKVVVDSSKVGTCQICNESTWALGNVTNGTAVGECKQCSNGQVVAKSGYTVPTCKVCNADGSLSNAPNGSNQQTNGECCVNGAMALSQTYCPICTFKNKIYLSDTDVPSSGKTCGWCQNGTIIEDHSYEVTACEYCNHDTWLWTTITPSQLTTTTTRSSITLYNSSHSDGYFNVYRKRGSWTNSTNVDIPISLGAVKITKYVYGLRKIDGTTTIGAYKYRTWNATQSGMRTLSDSSIKVNGVEQDLGTMVNGMLSLEKSGGSDLTQTYRERLVNLDGTTHNYSTDDTKRVWTQTRYYDFQGATYNVQPGKKIEVDIWTVCTDDSCQNFFCQP